MSSKICIVSGSYRSGGAEKVAIHLANELSRYNSEVYLIVMLNEGRYKELVSETVNLIELDVQRVRFAFNKLVTILKSINPDVVLSTQRQVNIITGLASYVACNAKIVFREATTLDNMRQEGRFKRFLTKSLIFVSYLSADLIIANSKFTAADLSKHIPLTSHKIVTIPNPVLTTAPVVAATDAIPHDWLSNGNETFLAVGRLHPLKDFSTLIKAFKLASVDYPNMRLLIIGEGDEWGILADLIVTLNLDQKVAMLGYRHNLEEFYSRAKALCLTSKWEGFGNVLVEAGAHKCPLISSNCPGGTSEILGFGSYGEIFEVGNAEALAKVMIKMVINTPDDKKLEEISRIFYTKYSIDSVSKKYLSTISC
jgi:glycosyltransferase involved in cell wall biosynthesis